MTLINNIKNNHILAITIGIVYIWFGVLKFFPLLSPAEVIAQNTISVLTFELIPPKVSIILLAIWETIIGVLLLLNIYRKPVILLTILHIICTFTPLLFFPDESFTQPFAYTLLGQYIFKNIIILAALGTLYQEVKIMVND